MDWTKYCCSCIILLSLLYLFTRLSEKYPPETFINPPQEDLLVSDIFPVQLRKLNVKYNEFGQYKPQTPLASYEQVTNNPKHIQTPENGSILIPELSAFAFYNSIR